jgi:hypothetical protein
MVPKIIFKKHTKENPDKTNKHVKNKVKGPQNHVCLFIFEKSLKNYSNL